MEGPSIDQAVSCPQVSRIVVALRACSFGWAGLAGVFSAPTFFCLVLYSNYF